jgi:hypothetical protein
MNANVTEIWRYPVKSMAGERLERASVEIEGVRGDRGWAVRDEVRGGIRGAKKIADLMRCAARYREEPGADPLTLPVPELRLPDGELLRADAPRANEMLSAAVGTQVTLWPRMPASDLDHYRRGAPDQADVETELRAIFGREKDEPLPDLSVFPPELFQYESPPGTYFDVAPMLLLTTATLRRLQELAPASRVDVRRFRPNLLIDCDGGDDGFPELGWRGRRLRVGGVTLHVTVACPRCVMITHPFDDLPKDTGLMRTVVREANQCVGVYARVETAGVVSNGDVVEVEA